MREAAAAAAMEWGAGAGASRLISGNMTPHRRLEDRLASFKGYESALLFGSGYLANTGVIAALAGKGDVVFSDELNHASIIDGCRLSRAETFVYRHGDLEHLAWGLREAGGRAALIVSDGIFSMDGDVAPLQGLFELARRHRCRLMVDEAHATGAIGPGGRGTVAAAGLSGEVEVVVGTLGKALGSYGAYVCAGAEIRDFLVNSSRPFIFSTAPPPPAVGAADSGAGAARSRARASRAAAGQRRHPARGAAAGGTGGRLLLDPDRADRDRRRRADDGALRAGPAARGLRPGHPPADRPRGLIAAALDGDVDPHVRRAGSRGQVDRRRRPRARPPRRPRLRFTPCGPAAPS